MAVSTLFYQHKGTITQFMGEHIAHCSTDHPGKNNWIELDLFISENDQWILQGIGRTRVEGEHDIYWCKIAFEPMDIIEELIKEGRRGRTQQPEELSWPAKCLLSEALKYLSECVCD